jgi:hypothetical protein
VQPTILPGVALTSILAAILWWPHGWGIFPEPVKSSAPAHPRAARKAL